MYKTYVEIKTFNHFKYLYTLKMLQLKEAYTQIKKYMQILLKNIYFAKIM